MDRLSPSPNKMCTWLPVDAVEQVVAAVAAGDGTEAAGAGARAVPLPAPAPAPAPALPPARPHAAPPPARTVAAATGEVQPRAQAEEKIFVKLAKKYLGS